MVRKENKDQIGVVNRQKHLSFLFILKQEVKTFKHDGTGKRRTTYSGGCVQAFITIPLLKKENMQDVQTCKSRS